MLGYNNSTPKQGHTMNHKIVIPEDALAELNARIYGKPPSEADIMRMRSMPDMPMRDAIAQKKHDFCKARVKAIKEGKTVKMHSQLAASFFYWAGQNGINMDDWKVSNSPSVKGVQIKRRES